MSEIRLSFALSNGGHAATDIDSEELAGVVHVLNKGEFIGAPGVLINSRHIVSVQVEEIQSA